MREDQDLGGEGQGDGMIMLYRPPHRKVLPRDRRAQVHEDTFLNNYDIKSRDHHETQAKKAG